MKKEEGKYLFDEKIKEGKSISQANKEIKRLKQSQVKFKKLERENIRLNKQVEKLQEQVNKQKKRIMDLDMKSRLGDVNINMNPRNSTRTIHIARIGDLTRVITILKEEKKPMSINQIKQYGLFPTSSKVKQCLVFLKNHNMVKQEGYGFKII